MWTSEWEHVTSWEAFSTYQEEHRDEIVGSHSPVGGRFARAMYHVLCGGKLLWLCSNVSLLQLAQSVQRLMSRLLEANGMTGLYQWELVVVVDTKLEGTLRRLSCFGIRLWVLPGHSTCSMSDLCRIAPLQHTANAEARSVLLRSRVDHAVAPLKRWALCCFPFRRWS
jgi:hypothetical protein